jgi:hypothetical protein
MSETIHLILILCIILEEFVVMLTEIVNSYKVV